MDFNLPGSSLHGISQVGILAKENGLPFSSPGDLLDPGIEPTSPALTGRLFPTEPPGKAGLFNYCIENLSSKP